MASFDSPHQLPAQQPCAGVQNLDSHASWQPTGTPSTLLSHSEMDTDSPMVVPATSASVQTSTNPPHSSTSTSGSFVTLEPFIPSQRRRRRRRLHELVEPNSSPTPGETAVAPHKSFFVVTSSTGRNLAEIDVIAANAQLERLLRGKPKSISELRSGDLLVEVSSKAQGDALLRLTHLADCAVSVAPHERLNQSRGTIYYANKPKYTTAQLQSTLADFHVVDVHQMSRKRNGVTEHLPLYVLTFASCQLPSYVSIGWTRCSVRLYVPRPRRCYKCQKFGHSATSCRSTTGLCANCGEVSHPPPCTNPSKCSNCDGSHPASSQNCFYYTLEQEILTTQAKDRLSYRDAKRSVTSRFVRPNQSFASKLLSPVTSAGGSSSSQQFLKSPMSASSSAPRRSQKEDARRKATSSPSTVVSSSTTSVTSSPSSVRPISSTLPSNPNPSNPRPAYISSAVPPPSGASVASHKSTAFPKPSSSTSSSSSAHSTRSTAPARSTSRDSHRKRSLSVSGHSDSAERSGKQRQASPSPNRETSRHHLLKTFPIPASFPSLPPTPDIAQMMMGCESASSLSGCSDDRDLPSPSPILNTRIPCSLPSPSPVIRTKHSPGLPLSKPSDTSSIHTIISPRPPS